MANLYFTLPRELRDCIYEYTLTDPLGLNYRTGRDGINRICAGSSLDASPAALSNTDKNYRLITVLKAMFSPPHGQQQSENFNQIQYVSRAFHKETYGLEFKYNTVWFEDGERLDAARRCRIFVSEVTDKDYADYLTLCIMPSHLFPTRKMKPQAFTLLEFCVQHPKATIRLHDSLWSLEDPKFILIGLAYTTALRGDQRMLAQLMHHADPKLRFDLPEVYSTVPKRIPQNYRILPAEKTLNKAILMESYKRASILDGTDVAQWIHLAERWFKEGL
jgi:hypothetical protein